ncbi:hypothetical protein Trydic_g6028 [Trypoxylus dichotomus]
MEFVPEKQHLREVLLHYYLLKKSAAETCSLLVDHSRLEPTCKYFDVNDKERDGALRKFRNEELDELVHIDSC